MYFQNCALQFANKALLHLPSVWELHVLSLQDKGEKNKKTSLGIITELSKCCSCRKEPHFHLLFCLIKEPQDIAVSIISTASFEIKVVSNVFSVHHNLLLS